MWLHRLAFTVVLLWLAASGSASPDAKRLYDDLLSSYDRYCQRNAHVLLGPAHEYVWGMIDNLTKWLKWTGANRKKPDELSVETNSPFICQDKTYLHGPSDFWGFICVKKTDHAIWKGMKYWARKCKKLCTYILIWGHLFLLEECVV